MRYWGLAADGPWRGLCVECRLSAGDGRHLLSLFDIRGLANFPNDPTHGVLSLTGGSYGDTLVGAEIVHYSSLAPRTYLCARLLEPLD